MGRDDVSFTDFFMFSRPATVTTVTVLMRQPRKWGYFGITSAALLAEPGASLVVSGKTASQSGCVVQDTANNLLIAPCLDAIATGMGHEIFLSSESGALESASAPGYCMALAGANPVGGGAFLLKACDAVGAEGRFSFAPSGQLKLQGLGNYCVTAGDTLSVQDCDEASKSSDARDKFFLVSSLAVDTNVGTAAGEAATLATAAAGRLSTSIASLTSVLQSCSFLGAESLPAMKQHKSSDFAALIQEARKIIGRARSA